LMRPLQALLRSRSLAGSAPDENRPAADAGRRPLVAAGAVVLVVLLLVSAVTPGAAQAKGVLGTGISIPNPISLIGSGVSSLLGGLGGDIAKLAVGAFEAIIKALFAPIAKLITTQLIGWVITVPDLTQSNVSRLEQTVEAMGGGAARRGRDDLDHPLRGTGRCTRPSRAPVLDRALASGPARRSVGF
jgi:hypothetical protein